jgi:hypothetical protein
MALEAVVGRPGLNRAVLQEGRGGVYVFIFEREDSPFPERDHHQDDWEQAKEFCLEDYGITAELWQEIPDQRIGSIRPMS